MLLFPLPFSFGPQRLTIPMQDFNSGCGEAHEYLTGKGKQKSIASNTVEHDDHDGSKDTN